jgi:hypothetical protein
MQNGNEVAMWVLGFRRTMPNKADALAHIDAQLSMDVDGREFWTAARALVERGR